MPVAHHARLHLLALTLLLACAGCSQDPVVSECYTACEQGVTLACGEEVSLESCRRACDDMIAAAPLDCLDELQEVYACQNAGGYTCAGMDAVPQSPCTDELGRLFICRTEAMQDDDGDTLR